MTQSPMISAPIKATNEIDWVGPLKAYIRDTYGDDPERYAEECATLNRLRQNMRGAGKDSIPGRDILYRYYGQLELLDLRFPVDEQHIKISFTWFDAFTHKPTTQYSLAFEKASVIFNISAVLSCYGALQNRADDPALKTAYHSFQASAGMFTYINDNFLHAPSFDLSRECVKALIQVMLAQAQEIFLEKQVADQKKIGLLAKLASQTAYLYAQAVEGVQENVNKAVFEKVWLTLVQIKTSLFNSKAQYYQALADAEGGEHGAAVSRLRVAESLAKEAERTSRTFPATLPAGCNLSAETSGILQELSKRQHATVQEKLLEEVKDNDFVYHQTVPPEPSLPPISKLPAAKPIPVSELYAGQDISRITGPDLFSKIVPLAVTESASLYDEEKAKLVRAETEKADTANGEMAAALDYLRLPGALQVLKGGFDQELLPDEDFKQWCDDVADHENPSAILEWLRSEKESIVSILDRSGKQLDMEESVCEKMRSKYDGEWSQQPSARLTTTLRGDIRSYREALEEAMASDSQLDAKLRQSAVEFDEMRRAAQNGEVDGLYQRAVAAAKGKAGRVATSAPEPELNLLDADFGEGESSVADQVVRVEDLLKKLNLVKRERNQVLKDLKEKVHNDDISQVLILNKKSISNYETQLFEQELGKFRPHQNRLLQANHKQSTLMKELMTIYNALLQDKRVRSERTKYEAIQRQTSVVVNRYKRAYQEFLDLEAGLQSAKNWYAEMRETAESLEKNVETFVNNRRSEGAQLLNQIEQDRSVSKNSQAELERERLRGLMERMSMGPAKSPPRPASGRPTPAPLSLSQAGPGPARYPQTNYQGHFQVPTSPPPNNAGHVPQQQQHHHQQHQHSAYGGYSSPAGAAGGFSPPTYNPSQYGPTAGPRSPPPTQTSIGQGARVPQPYQSYGGPQGPGTAMPHGFVPPPPPPGPPPLGPQQTIHYGNQEYEVPQGTQSGPSQAQQPHDPWAGLSAWK
ncbi:Vacuolar protein-sorting protein BRO1 [Ophiocordyceps camponoti-floridani]|uniref:BRO domain-containing protein 1 n=1 Tax=Ophiocordyceps camponoti-floridani TaxID=2030778 RepID=A0A8H4VDC8_9HYPO|nr:Vacuolar protein-sorting protein BRO1 [Ophiocordyceps camponoti-floridani]